MPFEKHLRGIHQLNELFRAFAFGKIILYLFTGNIMRRRCIKAVRTAAPHHKVPIAYTRIEPYPCLAQFFINILYDFSGLICGYMVCAEIVHIYLAVLLTECNKV